MALVNSSPVAAARGRVPSVWLSAAVLAACAAFMFLDARTTPIVLWDESRIAVNALEMYASGRLRLVTTYGFQPDLWNTKPPLLVWLMDASVSVFGPSEWALRLPSAAASLGVLVLAMSFTRRVTGSIRAGALAAVLLTLSLLFFGEHGARTGDYEALLAVTTLGYLYVLFFALHRRRPAARAVMLAGGLVAMACLTKGIAGLLPGVGVATYLALTGRWARPLRPVYLASAVLAAALVGGYLLLRERAAPGYLHAMLFNDVSGRFNAALDRHNGPPWFYLSLLFADGAFSAGLLALLTPLALIGARGRVRLGLLYNLLTAAGVLAVLSLSATKLSHYAMTACAPLAIACAIAAHRGLEVLGRMVASGQVRQTTSRVICGLALAMLALGAARAAQARLAWMPKREFYPEASYGQLFRALAGQGVTAVIVADEGVVRHGVVAEGVPTDYDPLLDAYRLMARSWGLRVDRTTPAQLEAQAPGRVVATCDVDLEPRVHALGAPISTLSGCLAVRRR